MRALMAAGATVAICAGSADATLFSFASDDDHTSWTFAGFGSGVGDANDPSDPLTLLIDDDNGPLPPLAFSVEFDARFDLTYVGSTPLPTGDFVHSYMLSGSFTFIDAAAGPILTARVQDAALTALGGQATWYSTATMQGSDLGPGNPVVVDYAWSGPSHPGYGLVPGPLLDPSDFAFTLTALNVGGVPGVVLDPQTMLPGESWVSEGSYSGSAVPSPAPVVLLAVGVLVGIRRRR